MRYERMVPLMLMVLLLAGCYRQAGDAFETVDGQAGQEVPVQPTLAEPTATVIIINPNATEEPLDLSAMELTATAIADDVVEDAPMLLPTEEEATDQPEPTATVIVIQLDSPTNTPIATPIPLPQSQGAPTLLPTSTPPTFITPQAVEQLPTEIPVTPTAVTRDGTTASGLVTPTALPEQIPGECVYIVQGGDNLFRIALNNNVALADLLAVNNLAENSIIQPNQELRLPGCTAEEAPLNTGAPETIAPTALPTGTALHVVVSGETLLTIARRYGVTVSDIVSANSLSNPDRLSVGQELIIPNQ